MVYPLTEAQRLQRQQQKPAITYTENISSKEGLAREFSRLGAIVDRNALNKYWERYQADPQNFWSSVQGLVNPDLIDPRFPSNEVVLSKVLQEQLKPLTSQFEQAEQARDLQYQQIQQKYESPEAQQAFDKEIQNRIDQLFVNEIKSYFDDPAFKAEQSRAIDAMNKLQQVASGSVAPGVRLTYKEPDQPTQTWEINNYGRTEDRQDAQRELDRLRRAYINPQTNKVWEFNPQDPFNSAPGFIKEWALQSVGDKTGANQTANWMFTDPKEDRHAIGLQQITDRLRDQYSSDLNQKISNSYQRELDALGVQWNRLSRNLMNQIDSQEKAIAPQIRSQIDEMYQRADSANIPFTEQDILGAFNLAPKTTLTNFLTGNITAQQLQAAQTPAQPAAQPAAQQTQQAQPVTQPEALLSQAQPVAQPAAQPVTQPAAQPVAQPAIPAESPFLTGTAPVAPATTTAMTAPVTAATEIPTDWNQPAIPGTSMATSQQSSIPNWVTPPSPYAMVSQVVTELTNPVTGEKFIAPTGGYSINQSALTPQSPTTTAAQQTQANQMGTGLMPSMANALGGIGSAIGNVAGGIPAGIGGQQAMPQTFLTGTATQPTGLTPESLPALRGTASGQSAVDPALRPYLELGLRGAEQLFLQQAPSLYPGQMYVSPSQQTLDALAHTEAIARAQPSALQAAQESYMAGLGGLGFTAGGGFLGSNPFQQRAIEAATRPIMQQFEQTTLPTIAGQFSAAGRYGSGAMGRITGQAQEASSRALGDVAANIAYTDYARERGLQDAAIRNQLQASTLAPQIYGQQFLPAQQLAQVGAAREAIAAQPLQEAITRYQYQQQLPYQQLGGFLSSIYGTPLAGSQYQTPAQAKTNTAANALGLAALGGGIGSMIAGQSGAGGFTRPELIGGGAVLGGLAGLLG